MSSRKETLIWATLALGGSIWIGLAGCAGSPDESTPDAMPPDTSPAKVDTMPPDAEPAKPDTSPTKVDTSPAKPVARLDAMPVDTMPPDAEPAKPDTSPAKVDTMLPDAWQLPAGCLICEGNGLAFVSVDPYSDSLPCASKAIAYQCKDCSDGTTSKRACCMPSVDCKKLGL